MAESGDVLELQYLKGIGPKNAERLAKIGITTLEDLVYHLPRRYEDRRNLPSIGSLRPGDFATVRGRLATVSTRTSRAGMVMLRAILRDGTGTLALTWFNQPWIKRQLEDTEGEIIAYGQVKDGQGPLEIQSPEWEILDPEDSAEDFLRIVPVYPLTEGLPQRNARLGVRSALAKHLANLVDPLPPALLQSQRLNGLAWCLQQIHWPDSETNRIEARRRLVFEEFFYLQMMLAIRRAETQQELGIAFPIEDLIAGQEPPIPESAMPPKRAKAASVKLTKTPTHLFASEQEQKLAGVPLWEQVDRMLPFSLTGAQRRVITEIWSDMAKPHPMNRLLQGDVGSGKTAVAACAILAAVRSGYQAALMAPTEILAEQHAASVRRLFEPLGIEVELLVGKLTASQKKKAAERTASGYAKVAVGTHALIQEGVSFANLGLAVVDEQHRFGVLQRKALRDKGLGNPDVLVMTATPIPRTLAMTTYGDLDLSVIDELPPGRQPVKTHWKPGFERQAVYQGVRKLLSEGRQAYIVCPMVSENEKMLAQAAEDLHYRLTHEVYPDLRVGLLHGQMKPKEKEETMDRFRAHDLDILVSTTVIEVGVDVPNASVMVIEDANRFGLSQLHQLRGRVGRGEFKSYCVLIADVKSDDARTRMETMVETTDGFRIAEVDFELRGPGEMTGTKQSGNADFKVADLLQDGRMLEVARQAASEVIARDPALAATEWRLVLERVKQKRADAAMITIS
jgi:ATP-dependent DNA helicase RecG